MSEQPDLTPPERTGLDEVHTITSAGIAAIPIIGGAVAEIFKAVLATPLELRTQEWRKNIVSVIEQLQKAEANIVPRLQKDQAFQSVLLQATWAAVRNHQIEKLTALKNAVVNAACRPKAPEDLQLLFVRYVDELTPTHLLVMNFFVKREKEVAHLGSYQEMFDVFSKVMAHKIDAVFFKLVCDDLKARSLVRISADLQDFPGLYDETSLGIEKQSTNPKIIVTDMGRAFIEFVLINPLGGTK